LKALAYDSRINSCSNATGVDTATVKPCAKKQRNIAIGLGGQDS